MSLLAGLFGGSRASLSQTLQLDLARLQKVVSEIGDTRLALRLFWHRSDPAEQLHLINRYLGEQLAEATARDRLVRTSAFVRGDDALPGEVKSAASTPPEAHHMLDAGCAALGKTLTDGQVEAILNHLSTKPVLLGHVPSVAKEQVASIDLVPPESNYGCYSFRTSARAPASSGSQRRTSSSTWRKPISAARRPCTRSTPSGRSPIGSRTRHRRFFTATGRTIGAWRCSPSSRPSMFPRTVPTTLSRRRPTFPSSSARYATAESLPTKSRRFRFAMRR